MKGISRLADAIRSQPLCVQKYEIGKPDESIAPRALESIVLGAIRSLIGDQHVTAIGASRFEQISDQQKLVMAEWFQFLTL